MKYQPYPKYKDSGVEWLGEIPEGWDIPAIGYHYEVQLGKMLDTSRITENNLFPYLRNVDVQWDAINVENLPEMSFDEDAQERYRLNCGDLLVCEGGDVGRCAIWNSEISPCYYQKALHRLRPYNIFGNVPRFLFYYFLAGSLNEAFTLGEDKATIPHLTAEQVRALRFPAPLHSVQRAIAAFLDVETSRIDGLVKDYEELIALLKEKRQALISHAVTRGLSELVSPDDPEFGEWAKPVKFKNSGVEWIGEIPEGWETWQLKRDVETVTSGSRGWAEFYSEEGAIFIRIGNLTRDGIDLLLDDIQRVEVPENSEAIRTKVCESDLLVSITADIGSVALVENLSETAYISQHLAICRFLKLTRILPRWAAYFLKSHSGKTQFDQKAYGGTKIQLSLDDVKELLITIPPKKGQISIDSFLDKETYKIDTLISESESAIELLKEHRSALITNAVTGKINVEASA